jgi:replication factor C large subunit
MVDWTEKYRPTALREVRGNDKARDAFREWAETWDDHREAVVLHGSPGVGKTSAAHALSNDFEWETVELNASDQRTADVIERLAGGAARNQSLTSRRQLVVLDEADNLHQHSDRGGARAMTDLVAEAGQPVVLIANDYYEMARGLRSATREIEFRDVSARSIVPVLRDICRKEDVEFDEDVLQGIAEQNAGDLRGAIRDLQTRVVDGRVREGGEEGERDRTLGIFDFLDAVLKEQSAEAAIRTAYDTDETPDDLVQWVEDKASKVYEGDELADAYDALARADRWLGRVRATQNYSYWRYVTDNVAGGVAAARRGSHGGWTRYGGAPYRSSRDATRDYVARKIAEVEGTSVATARRAILPFLSAMTHLCRDRELTVAMAARYEFDAEHVSFVTGSGKTTNKVESIVEDARERREAATVEHSGAAFAPRDVETTAGDDAESGSGTDDDGEATLGGGESADDAEEEAVDAEETGENDQQAGLGDFV